MRRTIATGLLSALAASAAFADSPRALSDADLLAYAAKPFDKGAMMLRRVVLGRHNGALVVADFPCSDLCPQYTTRVIHYDAPPGAACDAIGGVTVTRMTPFSIAMVEKPFCVPRVLAGRE